MKNKWLIILVLVMTIPLAGCKNSRDLEDESFVLALGVEQVGEKYLIRYSFADFSKSDSDTGIRVPSTSATFLTTSLKDGNQQWRKYQRTKLNFGHLKAIIYGGGKAKNKITKELLNMPQIAKSVYILNSKKSIYQIFSEETKMNISFGEYVAKALESGNMTKNPAKLTLGRVYQ